MSVEFADICQSYAYTYCTKTALKEMWLKRTTTQTISKLLPHDGTDCY